MTIDLTIAIIVLAVLFALEGAIPFYPQGTGRYGHGARNLSLALINGLIGAVLAPLVVLAVESAAAADWGLCRALNGGWACALVALALFDLWMYAWHRANHELPLLWRLHRVHHTDPAMDSTTALRFHPGEVTISTLLNIPVLVLLGIGIGEFIVYKSVLFAVILFHHSNVSLAPAMDRALKTIIVSPSMHRVHHSERRGETNSNYGSVFSFWDRLFRSYREVDDPRTIVFGIGAYQDPPSQRLAGLLALPFRRS